MVEAVKKGQATIEGRLRLGVGGGTGMVSVAGDWHAREQHLRGGGTNVTHLTCTAIELWRRLRLNCPR